MTHRNHGGLSAMNHSLPLASRLRIPDGVLSRNLQGEEVILNLNTGVYFGLDPVGARIWHLIQQHESTQKVLDALLEEYDVSHAQCAQDLFSLVVQMREKGLVEVCNGTDP